MKIRQNSAITVAIILSVIMAAAIAFPASAMENANDAAVGREGESANTEAVDPDSILNNRCFINGYEVRAYNIDDYIYIPVNDLAFYGFEVTEDEIKWAGTDYRFNYNCMPTTDDGGMLSADPAGETHKIKAGDKNPILYVVNGEMCLDALDLAAAFGYESYDEERNIMNIYVTAAGYEKNETGYRNVTIDASQITGKIRSLQGTHANQSRGCDFGEVFPELNVDIIRTHDFKGMDLSDIYIPMVKGDAEAWNPLEYDPDDWNNYDFSAADKLVDDILSTGSQVFFRFGDGHYPDAVPDSPERWEDYLNTYVEIARHIILYYNFGEHNDGKYNDVINWFEFWNEPDLTAFWDGNTEQFYEFYDRTAQAVKEIDPDILFGGPVLTTLNDYTGYMDSFIKHIAENNIPMDFYSYHYYPTVNGDPYEYTRLADRLSALLEENGFEGLPLTLTEWDTKIYLFPGANIQYEDYEEAAYVAAAMIYLQDSSVENADLYSFNPLIKTDESKTVMGLSKKGYAFRALGEILKTPERLAVTGADKNGFAVLAGKNEEDHIGILISNYQIPTVEMFPNNTTMAGIVGELVENNDFAHPEGVATWTLPAARVLTYANAQGYNLTVRNLPAGKDALTIQIWRIDQNNDWEMISSDEVPVQQDGSIDIEQQLGKNAVEYISIY